MTTCSLSYTNIFLCVFLWSCAVVLVPASLHLPRLGQLNEQLTTTKIALSELRFLQALPDNFSQTINSIVPRHQLHACNRATGPSPPPRASTSRSTALFQLLLTILPPIIPLSNSAQQLLNKFELYTSRRNVSFYDGARRHCDDGKSFHTPERLLQLRNRPSLLPTRR